MNEDQTFSSPSPGGKLKEFLGIHFVRCGTYARIYKNQQGTSYSGHCPRCMHPIRVRIAPGGTGNRFFKCFCP
jgi:hypothetical protein